MELAAVGRIRGYIAAKEQPQPRAWYVAAIGETVQQIQENERRYNMAEDPDMLEYFIFTRKALEARYRYLHRLARLGR